MVRGGTTAAPSSTKKCIDSPEGTRYADIVTVFGEPQFGESPDGKMKVEWVGKINGLVFTIYDYKSNVEPEDNTDWHIGGKIKIAAELVNAYYKSITSVA